MKSAPLLAALIALALGFLAYSESAVAQPRIDLTTGSREVGRYEKIEFSIQLQGVTPEPAGSDSVEPTVALTTPGGRQLTVPAFLYQAYERRSVGGGRGRDWAYPVGRPTWRARFAPAELGRYQAAASFKNATATLTSAPVGFESVPSSNNGFIQVSRKAPRYLEFTGGKPFFALGQNLAFIGPQQYVTWSKAEQIFGKLAANGANYLRVWTGCEDWALAIEARKSAWGRSWDWRPPIVSAPGSSDTNRLCLQLSEEKPVLNVNPSYDVALRPGTRYTLRGKVRTASGSGIRLELGGATLAAPLTASEGEWAAFRREFDTGPDDWWLKPLSFHLDGTGSAWLADLSLQESVGGPELLWEADVNRPKRGFYNPLDCYVLDELLAAAGKHGIYLQLCLLTRDLYMSALADASSPAYGRAISDAKKLFGYAVARWGYSTSVGAWEYWNEMNPNLPTDRFYTELGEYLEQVDPYHHLRTTSAWGPSPKDCRHPKLDVADAHFYLRPTDQGRLVDEVDAVIERTRWLREQAPNKPIHLGEFGLADDKWRITEEMQKSGELADVHNALWASALSGAAGSAMPWWWERIDQRGGYENYRALGRFIADVPWTEGQLESVQADVSVSGVRAVGLVAKDRAWVWVFDHDGAWSRIVTDHHTPRTVKGAEISLKALPVGEYTVRWWNTQDGGVVRQDRAVAEDGGLNVTVPEFSRDIACQVRR